MPPISIDKIAIIKDRLTMRDVLARYGFEPKKRMKCPIHNGDDYNFSVMDKGYMCFSHCGGGDVITFVQKLFNLSFADTLRKIDTDFNLGLYGKKDLKNLEKLRQSKYKSKVVKARQERIKSEKQHADDEYWAVFDEWKRLDDNKRNYAPKTPDEEWHPLFVEALQKLAYQEYLLNEADERRCRN